MNNLSKLSEWQTEVRGAGVGGVGDASDSERGGGRGGVAKPSGVQSALVELKLPLAQSFKKKKKRKPLTRTY